MRAWRGAPRRRPPRSPVRADGTVQHTALAARPAYWAQVWPSAVAAGERLLAEPDLVQDKRVLELGAGLGLTACCAALAGARSVLATDREPGSASYVKANADENGLAAAVNFLQLDWSRDWTALVAENAFDVAIASDVVYDHDASLQLAPLLRWAVAPGGTVLLVDAADRPYEGTRRSALLECLCSDVRGDEGLFELVRTSRSRVALKTRQGDEFQIAECVLRRRI